MQKRIVFPVLLIVTIFCSACLIAQKKEMSPQQRLYAAHSEYNIWMEKTLDLVDVVYPERENWISSTTVTREFVLSRLRTIGEDAEKYFNLAWTVGASIETVIDKMEDFVLEVQSIYSEIKEGENK